MSEKQGRSATEVAGRVVEWQMRHGLSFAATLELLNTIGTVHTQVPFPKGVAELKRAYLANPSNGNPSKQEPK